MLMSISIHALLAESDFFLFMVYSMFVYFYPRSPCGERRPSLSGTAQHIYFYPRSPCGERQYVYVCYTILVNFYPRSPCGERLTLICPVIAVMTISIHALLAESDNAVTKNTSFHKLFLSTLSLRRATGIGLVFLWWGVNFYPRSPCGERLFWYCLGSRVSDFYPRSPCGERHEQAPYRVWENHFYPRSPCGERPPPYNLMIQHKNFYPRSPCGERLNYYAI